MGITGHYIMGITLHYIIIISLELARVYTVIATNTCHVMKDAK